jgi:hypothetical protein
MPPMNRRSLLEAMPVVACAIANLDAVSEVVPEVHETAACSAAP